MVLRIVVLFMLISLGSCCDDSLVKTQVFDEETLKWLPTETDIVQFKSSDGLSESYEFKLYHQVISGFSGYKRCSWTGERSNFSYQPALYGNQFSGGISVYDGARRFSFKMNDRSFSFDLLNKENIQGTYISDIRHLDSLVLGDTTLFDLLLIKDPMLDSSSSSILIRQVFMLKHAGIVRYDYIDGTIWNRVLN